HVAPPSSVWTMAPKSPTAVPRVGETNAILNRLRSTGVFCSVHVAPPSLVLNTRPLVLEIQACLPSRQEMPRNGSRPETICRCHVRPQSVVLKTRPRSPTTQPSVGVGKQVSKRFWRISRGVTVSATCACAREDSANMAGRTQAMTRTDAFALMPGASFLNGTVFGKTAGTCHQGRAWRTTFAKHALW